MQKTLYLVILLAQFLCLGCARVQQQAADDTMEDGIQSESSEQNSDCANCGMPSLEFPKWVSRADEHYFCSPRCLFLKIQKEPEIKSAKSLTVMDYYEAKVIAASNAFFVIGSDITGPMGHDFVPFTDEAAAKDFLKEHKGIKILRMANINETVIKEVMDL